MRLKGICLACVVVFSTLAGCDRAPHSAVNTDGARAPNPAVGARWQYPRAREVDGRKFIVYAPQIRSWEAFRHFTAQVAVQFTDADADARYAVIDLSGETVLDRDARLVVVARPKADRVTLSDGQGSEAQTNAIRAAIESEPIEIPLDVLLHYLADGVLESAAPAGFNDQAPPIHVVESPTFLLFVNGAPVASAIGGSGLELISNANFPVFRDARSGSFYLLSGDYRYRAARLAGPWTAIVDLPLAFRRIAARGETMPFAAVIASTPKSGAAPGVITTFKPAEIVVLEGKPRGRPIPGAAGLEAIANTDSPLFRLDGKYYLLVAGRWFSTGNLQGGPWKFTMPLPDAFSRIPHDDAQAKLLASVPGTPAAHRAALEAKLPRQKIVKAGAAPDVTVAYAGDEPTFEPIRETQVARAANAGNDIIRSGERYYLCYESMWYVADEPTGPWAATADVPAAVYEIPPSSPSYAVTRVTVRATDDGHVESTYDAAYASETFVAFGVTYYGTGWYYPPYYRGGYYFPYNGSYGHGSWYDPDIGGFSSRSAYYGPYGGFSYNQGYNPKTGRYHHIETAWDGNEWTGLSANVNWRTGISTETGGHHGDESGTLKMERTFVGPGGGNGDVYAGRDGGVYRKTDEGWQHRDVGVWSSIEVPDHAAAQNVSELELELERDAAARRDGFQAFQRRAARAHGR